MSHLRPLVALALLLAACVLSPATAGAVVALEDVAAGAVAVEEGASISDADRERLERSARALTAAGTPVKYVVLAERPADPQGYAAELGRRLGYRGDILVLSPGNLAIGSRLPDVTVQGAFEAQRPALRRDPVAGTIAVAEMLAQARRAGVAPAGGGSSGSPARDDGGDGAGGGVLLSLLPLLFLGGILLLVFRAMRGRGRPAAAARPDPASLDPLVDALAAQIADLEDDMRMAGPAVTAARPHHDEAVLAYGEARELLGAPSPGHADVRAAGAALERGLRAARRTRAVLEGRPIADADREPLLEGMCAFDPKHGRATTTVTIGTPSGDSAELPACDRCAAQMARGDQPPFREVEQDGRRVPYWEAGPLRGGAFGGGFAGPVLGGALAGLILGGMFGAGGAMAAGGDQGDWAGGGGDFGGGGGDFGGFGDFGGGGGDF